MKSNAVVSKYTKALFETTYENGSAGVVAQQIKEISTAFDGETIKFFENPSASFEQKSQIVKNALEGKASAHLVNFMTLLIQKKRISFLSAIANEFGELVLKSAGITKGKLYSAVQLEPEFILAIQNKISKSLSKKIELNFVLDTHLLAGYKVEVEGWTMNDSAEAHFKILKDQLMKRGN